MNHFRGNSILYIIITQHAVKTPSNQPNPYKLKTTNTPIKVINLTQAHLIKLT